MEKQARGVRTDTGIIIPGAAGGNAQAASVVTFIRSGNEFPERFFEMPESMDLPDKGYFLDNPPGPALLW